MEKRYEFTVPAAAFSDYQPLARTEHKDAVTIMVGFADYPWGDSVLLSVVIDGAEVVELQLPPDTALEVADRIRENAENFIRERDAA